MKEGFLEIFNYFGARNQRDKLCEEFRELQDELYEIFVKGGDNENLLNEGVDVISIVLQFLYAYGYDDEEIISKLQVRQKRTIRRKNDGYYGGKRNEGSK